MRRILRVCRKNNWIILTLIGLTILGLTLAGAPSAYPDGKTTTTTTTSTTTSTTTTTLPNIADLSVSKTGPISVIVTDVIPEVDHTITVVNNGPGTSTNIMLTDNLSIEGGFSFGGGIFVSSTQGSCTGSYPIITCALGDLNVGSTAIVTIGGYLFPSWGASGGKVIDTTTVAGNEADPNTADNTATFTTDVTFICVWPCTTSTTTTTTTTTTTPPSTTTTTIAPVQPGRLYNISTRSKVLTGNDILIGGFIVDGNNPRTVLIRGRGPSMGDPPFNIQGTLTDPSLRVFSGATLIAQNDNWQTTDPLCGAPATWCGTDADISLTGADPCQPNPGQPGPPAGCMNESAIIMTVPPGSYTLWLFGADGGTGVGLVEVFDVTP